MAEHIVSEEMLDIWLASDDPTRQTRAYDHIAFGLKMKDSKYNKCCSFASKYCSWNNPVAFPIMDSIVRKTLSEMVESSDNDFSLDKEKYKGKNINIKSDGYDNYEIFKMICEDFLKYVNSKCEKKYTFKDIDKFLWKFGKSGEEYCDYIVDAVIDGDKVEEIKK